MNKQKTPLHKVYFIGAGPGHRKHLTREGSQLLKKCGLVFAMNLYAETFKLLLRKKTVLDPGPLGFEKVIRTAEVYRRTAPVAFLIPGDHSVFSPFQVFVEYFGEDAVQVAGVSVLSAAAAVLKKTLDQSDVANTIVLTSSRKKQWLMKNPAIANLRRDMTLVLYMNHVPMAELAAVLSKKLGSDCPVAVLYNLSLPEEKIVAGSLSDIAGKIEAIRFPQDVRIMSVVIAGRILTSRSGQTSWEFINEIVKQNR